jgi:hypothetical protein
MPYRISLPSALQFAKVLKSCGRNWVNAQPEMCKLPSRKCDTYKNWRDFRRDSRFKQGRVHEDKLKNTKNDVYSVMICRNDIGKGRSEQQT